MPSRNMMIEQAANQMMKSGKSGRLKATEEQKELFRKTHANYLLWATDNLSRKSAAIHAVVAKCLIAYEDHSRIREFCAGVELGLFKGMNDPAFLLWRFLEKTNNEKASPAMYGAAVAAAKAYMNRKELSRLEPAKLDIFNWGPEWTVPKDLLKTWNPNKVPLPI